MILQAGNHIQVKESLNLGMILPFFLIRKLIRHPDKKGTPFLSIEDFIFLSSVIL